MGEAYSSSKGGSYSSSYESSSSKSSSYSSSKSVTPVAIPVSRSRSRSKEVEEMISPSLTGLSSIQKLLQDYITIDASIKSAKANLEAYEQKKAELQKKLKEHPEFETIKGLLNSIDDSKGRGGKR